MKKILFLIFIGLIAVSCDRDLEFDTISVTDPALEVQVEGVATEANTYPKIADATVELYNSNGQLLATATTNTNGRVIFTREQLVEKGTFTVKASKGGLSGEATTAYLLLNDGVTFLIVTIQ
ncbi:MAG: hypothetical protein AB2L24_24780 [Mangrovibacterium sp.]